MSDRINIHGLEVYAHIGVPDEERSRRQKLLVNVALKVRSVSEAAAADDVKQTVDYAQLANEIKDAAAARPRKLIERLAEDLAAVVLQHELVREVTIEIEKFILPDTRCVSVEIRRKAPKRKKEKPDKPKEKTKVVAPHSLRKRTVLPRPSVKPAAPAPH